MQMFIDVGQSVSLFFLCMLGLIQARVIRDLARQVRALERGV